MIQVVASSDAHYDQLDAYGNYVFLGQILEADEIWDKTKKKAVNFENECNSYNPEIVIASDLSYWK